MQITTKPFLKMQLALDETIQQKHNVTYEQTTKERFLALFVELGELANETRTFKYWSHKAASKKRVLLEEYADALHFYFSLALAYNLHLPRLVKSRDSSYTTLSELFLKVYSSLNDFYHQPSVDTFITSLSTYLTLGKALYFSENEIKAAYERKMVVNYNRQEEDY